MVLGVVITITGIATLVVLACLGAGIIPARREASDLEGWDRT